MLCVAGLPDKHRRDSQRMDFTDRCSLLLWDEWASRKSHCLAPGLTLPGTVLYGLAHRPGAGQWACLPSHANGSKPLVTFSGTEVESSCFSALSCLALNLHFEVQSWVSSVFSSLQC